MDGNVSDDTTRRVNEAFGRTLENTDMDFSIKAYALTLPGESTLVEEVDIANPVAFRDARVLLD